MYLHSVIAPLEKDLVVIAGVASLLHGLAGGNAGH